MRHISKVTHPFSSFAFLSQRNLPQNMYCLFPDKPCNSSCTCSSSNRLCISRLLRVIQGLEQWPLELLALSQGERRSSRAMPDCRVVGQHMGKCPTLGSPELCTPSGAQPLGSHQQGPAGTLSCRSIPPTRTVQPAPAGHGARLHPPGLTPGIKINHSYRTGSLSSNLPEPQMANPARAKLEPCSAKPDISDSVTPTPLQLRLCTHK